MSAPPSSFSPSSSPRPIKLPGGRIFHHPPQEEEIRKGEMAIENGWENPRLERTVLTYVNMSGVARERTRVYFARQISFFRKEIRESI